MGTYSANLILVIPSPDVAALGEVAAMRDRRESCVLRIDPQTGDMSLAADEDRFSFEVKFVPEIRFLIFGKGPEASTFSALTSSAGYPSMLLSPDDETREDAESAGAVTRYLAKPDLPEDLRIDEWTAVLTFFHDHEWEPDILGPALQDSALWHPLLQHHPASHHPGTITWMDSRLTRSAPKM